MICNIVLNTDSRLIARFKDNETTANYKQLDYFKETKKYNISHHILLEEQQQNDYDNFKYKEAVRHINKVYKTMQQESEYKRGF